MSQRKHPCFLQKVDTELVSWGYIFSLIHVGRGSSSVPRLLPVIHLEWLGLLLRTEWGLDQDLLLNPLKDWCFKGLLYFHPDRRFTPRSMIKTMALYWAYPRPALLSGMGLSVAKALFSLDVSNVLNGSFLLVYTCTRIDLLKHGLDLKGEFWSP